MTRASLLGLLGLVVVVLSGCSSPQADRSTPPAITNAQPAPAPAAPAAPTASALTDAPPAPAPPAPGANQCQKDVGCGPAPALPKCPADLKTQPHTAALNLRKPITGQRVALTATLTSGLSCTELGCPDANPCCNSCGGAMRLGDYRDALTLVDTRDPERFAIRGDETLSCPPYPAGVPVVAIGTVGYDAANEVALIDPTFCAP